MLSAGSTDLNKLHERKAVDSELAYAFSIRKLHAAEAAAKPRKLSEA